MLRILTKIPDNPLPLLPAMLQSRVSTGEELGLLLTVSLGGLGMFLLVMAASFLAAHLVSKQVVFAYPLLSW